MRVPEIHQPQLQVPSPEDPMAWAMFSQIREQWMRYVAPQLGVDVEKLILGDVLSTIIGDDVNCFFWDFGGKVFLPESAARTQELLLFRLNWEIGVPELPDEVREKLEDVKAAFEGEDLSDLKERATYERAKEHWYRMKGEVEQMIDENPAYQEAISYRVFEWDVKFHTPYQEFLEEHRKNSTSDA